MHHDTVLLNPPYLQGTLVTGRIFLIPVLRPPAAWRGLQGHSWIPTALCPQLQHCMNPTVQRWSWGQLFCWSDSQTQAKLPWLRPKLNFHSLDKISESLGSKHPPPQSVYSYPTRPGCAVLSFPNVAHKWPLLLSHSTYQKAAVWGFLVTFIASN